MIYVLFGQEKPVKILPCSVSILDLSNRVLSISFKDFCRSTTDFRFEGVCRKANRKKETFFENITAILCLCNCTIQRLSSDVDESLG